MREDALHYGNLQAGTHAIRKVENHVLVKTLEKLNRDQEKREMNIAMAIIEGGGLAENCLLRPKEEFDADTNENQKNLDDLNEELRDPIMGGSEYLVFNFLLERADLRSLGFSDSKDKTVRIPVQKSLERSVAVAVACPE